MTKITTYTVFSGANGTVYGRDLSVAEAADIILTHDGRDYEVRQAGDRFELWTRQEVANVKWSRTVLSSYATTSDQAKAEIFAEVIAAGWSGHPDVMTDADYDAMLAELARDAG